MVLAVSESFSIRTLPHPFCESVNGSREYVALMMMRTVLTGLTTAPSTTNAAIKNSLA